jgi:hypothetical protein
MPGLRVRSLRHHESRGRIELVATNVSKQVESAEGEEEKSRSTPMSNPRRVAVNHPNRPQVRSRRIPVTERERDAPLLDTVSKLPTNQAPSGPSEAGR